MFLWQTQLDILHIQHTMKDPQSHLPTGWLPAMTRQKQMVYFIFMLIYQHWRLKILKFVEEGVLTTTCNLYHWYEV